MEIVPKEKKTIETRLKGKHWFLTFPQSGDVSKEAVVEDLKKLLGTNLLFAVVAQEKHQDGANHLHMGFETKETIRVKSDYWDQLTGKHGNYQAARSMGNVLKYIVKCNGNLTYSK